MGSLPLTRQQLAAYGLVGGLVVLFLGVLAYNQWLRAGPSEAPPARTAVSVEGLPASVAARPLNTEVLRDPQYQALDRSLVDQGRLPVPVPATRGKANLF